jgi:hypothetical protein
VGVQLACEQDSSSADIGVLVAKPVEVELRTGQLAVGGMQEPFALVAVLADEHHVRHPLCVLRRTEGSNPSPPWKYRQRSRHQPGALDYSFSPRSTGLDLRSRASSPALVRTASSRAPYVAEGAVADGEVPLQPDLDAAEAGLADRQPSSRVVENGRV